MNVDTLISIDQSFLTGLILTMIGASIVTYQTGFLNLFINGFKDLKQFIFPKSRALIRAEEQLAKEKELKNGDSKLSSFIKMLTFSIGTGSIVFSTILLFV